ncbi:MAG: glycosyltransferase [Bacillota bacterium]
MIERPSLSLCMIVRNEEACIASCLESVRDLVREMIIVDTGSVDGTRELAERFGARIYSFLWNGDFAAARNYSLTHATCDWILVLDADEVLEPVSPETLAALLEAPEVEGYFVHIQSRLDDGSAAKDKVVRLFRNKPVYRFTGAIHEQVAGAIKQYNNGKGLALSDLVIHHFGYLDRQVETKDKRRRNISVIEKALAGNPDDPFLLYSLGIEYFQGGEIVKGIAPLEKALALMHGGEGYFREALVTLALGYLRAGLTEKLALFLDKALLMLPGDADLHLLKGVLAMGGGCYTPAVEDFRRALGGGGQILPVHHIHTLLGDALKMLGRYGEAEEEYFKALCLAPQMLYPLTRILGLKQRGKSRIEWLDLSRFNPLSTKRALREELVKLGEWATALVLSLLSVAEAVGRGGGELVETCREHYFTVQQCNVNGFVKGLFKDFLLAAAGEMLVYAEAMHHDFFCDLFSPVQSLFQLASGSLELVAKGLCPDWGPALEIRSAFEVLSST